MHEALLLDALIYFSKLYFQIEVVTGEKNILLLGRCFAIHMLPNIDNNFLTGFPFLWEGTSVSSINEKIERRGWNTHYVM